MTLNGTILEEIEKVHLEEKINQTEFNFYFLFTGRTYF